MPEFPDELGNEVELDNWRTMKRRYLVFTDLDGTLLDESTYSFEAAVPALSRLKKEGHPLVFCTSKTFAESVPIQRRMGVEGPLIVENGGGIYLPDSTLSPLELEGRNGWKKIPLGVPYGILRRHLSEVREELGLSLIGLGDAGAELLRNSCDLTDEEAEAAMQREFDEPFLMPMEDLSLVARVLRAFSDRGLQVSQGGRFFHLSGNSDKGRAIRVLSNLVRGEGSECETVGLGDSPNDIPMLAAVEHPYLVMKPCGFYDPSVLKETFGNLKLVPGVGPAGWNRAILELLFLPESGPRDGNS